MIQVHVIGRIGLTVGQEEEVSVVCTLLAAYPHRPNKDHIEVGHGIELEIQDPQDHIEKLKVGWDSGVF